MGEGDFMINCKYYKIEISNGIEHEICLNEEMKKLNKTNDLHCIYKHGCGKFEEDNNETQNNE